MDNEKGDNPGIYVTRSVRKTRPPERLQMNMRVKKHGVNNT
jgi:hypothetical protein